MQAEFERQLTLESLRCFPRHRGGHCIPEYDHRYRCEFSSPSFGSWLTTHFWCKTFGNYIAEFVQDKLRLFVLLSTIFIITTEFLPLLFPVSSSYENRFGLLPFSNKNLDDELAPIRSDDHSAGEHKVEEIQDDEGVDDEGSDRDEWDTSSEDVTEEVMKACNAKVTPDVPQTDYLDDGIFDDTRHWYNHEKPQVTSFPDPVSFVINHDPFTHRNRTIHVPLHPKAHKNNPKPTPSARRTWRRKLKSKSQSQ